MCDRVNFREKDNMHLCDTCAVTETCSWFKFCQMNTKVKVCDSYESIYEHENIKVSYEDKYHDIEDSGKSDVQLNKYDRIIHDKINDNTCTVDVYSVLKAFDVRCPALQHLIKKALCAGLRGHKNKEQDLQDIVDSAIRARELGAINE